jgi:hypothetical protein
MLRSLKSLHGYQIEATDGLVGKVHDFYFHDDNWSIRYLVVDTGHWLVGRKVLLVPAVLGQPDWVRRAFPVSLTRSQVKESPDIDTDKPVSRQQETDLHQHYGWPLYWMEPAPGIWPPFVNGPSPQELAEASHQTKGDPYLRSAREVGHYDVHAGDGQIGEVDDFIVDDAFWVLRYMVVDTGERRKVLISPKWLGHVDYGKGEVTVSLTRDSIRRCPEFHPNDLVNREYEERLYDYYGRPGYWEKEGLPQQVDTAMANKEPVR